MKDSRLISQYSMLDIFVICKPFLGLSYCFILQILTSVRLMESAVRAVRIVQVPTSVLVYRVMYYTLMHAGVRPWVRNGLI